MLTSSQVFPKMKKRTLKQQKAEQQAEIGAATDTVHIAQYLLGEFLQSQLIKNVM